VITLKHTKLGRTPLEEGTARLRDLYLTTHNTHRRQTSMSPEGFEPAVPASERPHSHASDRADTGIGHLRLREQCTVRYRPRREGACEETNKERRQIWWGRVQLKPDGTRWRTGGNWRGNWRMEGVASTLHTTSERAVTSITNADAHTSASSSRLNWRPRRFKWTRPFRRKTKSGFCACTITFRKHSTIFLNVKRKTSLRLKRQH
jgi:hypothetical protein